MRGLLAESMNTRPLVSVVTPTWNRHDALLNVCVPSVQAQTYPNIEHIVVSDGMDIPMLTELLTVAFDSDSDSDSYDMRFIGLGRNWHDFTGGQSIGAIPRRVGCSLAQGDYIAYLDDDDEFLPEHIEKLVTHLEEKQVDFVFSQMERDWSDHRPNDIIGDGRILYGRVGTPMLLHKAECLQKVTWRPEAYGEDFTFYVDLMKAGYTFSFLPEVTVRYHKKV